MPRNTLALMLSAASLSFSMPSYDDVLLVVRAGDAHSAAVASYFQASRGIPAKNVATFTIPQNWGNGITLSKADRDSLAANIENYISANGLSGTINYIVLSANIPRNAYDDAANTRMSLVDTYLMYRLSAQYPRAWMTNNPYAMVRPALYTNRADVSFSRAKYGYYIVSRLDGPSMTAVKNMIDSTGAAAYDSWKSGVKYVVDSQSTLYAGHYHYAELQTEIESRGAVFQRWDTANANAMIHHVSNINFLDCDWVYGADNTMSRGAGVSIYPHQFKRLGFQPGSLMNVYRSFPAGNGTFWDTMRGLYSLSAPGGVLSGFARADGSDFAYRNISGVEVNPEDHSIWCAVSVAVHYLINGGYDKRTVAYEKDNGNGIVVYDKAGNITASYTKENTGGGLLCNAVYDVVYDRYNHRMWAATYAGVCYYDLSARAWRTPSGLSHPDGARVLQIYIDPTTAGTNVYVTFTPGASSYIPNMLPNWQRVFEHNTASGTTTARTFGYAGTLVNAQVVKTEPNTLWLRYSLSDTDYRVDKVNLASDTVLASFGLSNINGADHRPPSFSHGLRTMNIALSVFAGRTNIYVPVGAVNTATAVRNGILRITDGPVPTASVWGQPAWYSTSYPNDYAHRVVIDPLHPEKVTLVIRDHINEMVSTGKIISFSEMDTAGTEIKAGTASIGMGNDVVYDDETDGRMWVARYQYFPSGQMYLYELFNYGLSGAMGGASHDAYYCDGNLFSSGPPTSELISAANLDMHLYSSENNGSMNVNEMHQMRGMALLLMDGFSFAESRHGSLPQFPTQGGGGHVGHMHVFDPKCTPYAPRVDSARTPQTVLRLSANEYAVTAALEVPMARMSNRSFLPETITPATVLLRDALGTAVPLSSIVYDASSNTITAATRSMLTTGAKYYLTLAGGRSGIKCVTGAALVNTRPSEHTNDTTLEYACPNFDGTVPIVVPADCAANDLAKAAVLNNPYRGSGAIEFIGITADTSISIHTVSGRIIASLAPESDGRISWNATTAQGKRASPGVYLCILKSSRQNKVLKLMIAR